MVAVVVLPVAVDRLGDSKIQVRDQASETILKLMVPASHPQVAFKKSHKVCRVRLGSSGTIKVVVFFFLSVTVFRMHDYDTNSISRSAQPLCQ